MKAEMFFDEEKQEYTLSRENSIKKIPLRFKITDSTRRFRTEKLKEEILKK